MPPDALQLLVHVIDAVPGLGSGIADALQPGLHAEQVALRLQHLLLHVLIGGAGRVDALLFHRLQGLFSLLNNGPLRGYLAFQQLALLRHVGLRVPVGLELLFIQLQRLVKGLDGGLRLFHPLLKLLDSADAHLDVYAARHRLTLSL